MIALRTLIEICMREIRSRFDKLDRENFDDTGIGLLARFDMTLNMAFSPQGSVPQELQNKYKSYLTGKAKKKLKDKLEQLDLNTYVHNPAVHADSIDVITNLKALKSLLNFFIDSLAT
jgi:hypothetical protein